MDDHPVTYLLRVREAFDDYLRLDGRTHVGGKSPWERLYIALAALPPADELRGVTESASISP